MQTVEHDGFFVEGQDAWCDCVERSECPYPADTDGRFGWLRGWDSCQVVWENNKARVAE